MTELSFYQVSYGKKSCEIYVSKGIPSSTKSNQNTSFIHIIHITGGIFGNKRLCPGRAFFKAPTSTDYISTWMRIARTLWYIWNFMTHPRAKLMPLSGIPSDPAYLLSFVHDCLLRTHVLLNILDTQHLCHITTWLV